jgi:hypothetical protein
LEKRRVLNKLRGIQVCSEKVPKRPLRRSKLGLKKSQKIVTGKLGGKFQLKDDWNDGEQRFWKRKEGGTRQRKSRFGQREGGDQEKTDQLKGQTWISDRKIGQVVVILRRAGENQ